MLTLAVFRDHLPTPLYGPGTIQKILVEDKHTASFRPLTGVLPAGPRCPAPVTVTTEAWGPAMADQWLGPFVLSFMASARAKSQQMC